MTLCKKSVIIGGLCVVLASMVNGSSSVYSSGQNRTNSAAHQVSVCAIGERPIIAPWKTTPERPALLANALELVPVSVHSDPCFNTASPTYDGPPFPMKRIELASYHAKLRALRMVAADVSRGGTSQHPEEYRVLEVTAYYGPLPGQKRYVTGSYAGDLQLNGHGITHSGTTAVIGDVAADPAVFPHGTRLDVPGYGMGVVTDTGGAITGEHIDLFMGYGYAAMQKALEFGKKNLLVRVLSSP